jgi:hypothetical protein
MISRVAVLFIVSNSKHGIEPYKSHTDMGKWYEGAGVGQKDL